MKFPAVAILVPLLLLVEFSNAFQTAPLVRRCAHKQSSQKPTISSSRTETPVQRSTKPSRLSLFPFMSTSSTLRKTSGVLKVPFLAMKRAIIAMALGVVAFFRHNIFWPGTSPDKAYPDVPLPKESNGCPLLGINYFSGTDSYGTGAFMSKLFRRLGRPNLFRFYSFGMPIVSVAGIGDIQEALKSEFRKDGVGTLEFVNSFPNFSHIFGDKSVLYENDREKHAFLRRLVGGAMSPANLVQSVPAIERAASQQIDKIILAAKANSTVTMEKICNDFTLDVAWRQILGLDLKGQDEIEEFYENTRLWLSGLFNPIFMMPFRIPFLKGTKASRAREFLTLVIEAKVEDLKTNGPDDSTLSKMFFSRDEDGATTLTHQELVDNGLILILAGSETSSSTLVNCMLLLGLHKDVLHKLQEEQRAYILKHGSALSKEALDEDCPYLDGFIRETMRLRPISGMELRQTQKTLVVDGQQIPKKNYIYSNIRATHDQDPSVRVDTTDSHMDLINGLKPERWMNPETTPREWIAFGFGARRCLGERLAMTEMKVFLAMLVRNIAEFDLVGVERDEDVKWKKMSLLPIPADGVVIRPTAAM
ncbi:cytochrome P450 [Nitzschia inconspicua]|uniref:Cytochrome P450 n=1 Tax=Nitzschia inconspicua TaxID=303405 RepID=A0A9K3PUT1_9STRA|nr:cytochrome P450 [Nitzschia inconspicua]